MAVLILQVLSLLFAFSYASPVGLDGVAPSRLLAPRDTTAWTSLPTKTPCSGCYDVDATWTITASYTTVTTVGQSSFDHVAATVMAVISKSVITLGTTVVATSATMWPPPAVTAAVGQRVRLTVVNQMPSINQRAPENVTLHFHGLVQNGGQVFMDGPEGVTQWYVGLMSEPLTISRKIPRELTGSPCTLQWH